MKKWALRIMFVICALLSVNAFITSKTNAQNSGSIWTTRVTCGSEQQDVNLYNTGDTVFIHGANFAPGEYSWSIVGQPGKASSDPGIQVAGDKFTVNASGAFCFSAYTIPAGDSGVYNVTFASSKGDNYQVNELTQPTVTATATPTLTSTPTVTSTHTVTPTGTLPATVPPTETPITTPTSEPTKAPGKAPVTGSLASPSVLQGATALFALISIGAYALLKKKVD